MSQSLKVLACMFVAMIMAGAAYAADNTMFNYQGRVLVAGYPYNGTGRMKVAILAEKSAGSYTTLWSNDGSSFSGSEPGSSFSVKTIGGVFDVMIGDTSAGMQALPAIMFNRNDELKVRVWFSDGSHGFQQMSPDRRLTNPRQMGLTEVRSETTLYVNAATGNDKNSGIKSTAAKKTIQAAINMVPARLFQNVTIDVADGIYRESIKLTGITAEDPYKLLILGDESAIPSQSTEPAVRITGKDSDSSSQITRTVGINLNNCHNVEIKGFLVDYFSNDGIHATQGQEYLTQCKFAHTTNGVICNRSTTVVSNSWSRHNSYGYLGFGQAFLTIQNSGSSDNTGMGVLGQANCTVVMSSNNQIKNNPYGIGIQSSYLWFDSPTTYISNNSTAGVYLYYHSSSRNIGFASYSGNGTNQLISPDSWGS